MAQRLKTDWLLFGTMLALAILGLIVIYSASSVVAQIHHRGPYFYFLRQLAWAAASFVALMICKQIDYRRLRRFQSAVYPVGGVAVLLLLAAVMDGDHHRWIRFGGFQLQPSELAKPVLFVFLAYYLAKERANINELPTLLPMAGVTALLVGIIALGDLGTAIILALGAAAVFYVAGLNRRWAALAVVVVLVAGAGALVHKPYRIGRIVSKVDPDYKLLAKIDPEHKIKDYITSNSLATRDMRYQATQSKIAVGTGGIFGVGLMQGRQKLLYLPEAHTDFIYAVVGEELGLWGCSAILVGFVVILWRGLRLYFLAPDSFGQYLALGITACICAQAFVNMSVVLDIGPTKGLPLPLISHGGSSLLATMTQIGLLLSISEQSG